MYPYNKEKETSMLMKDYTAKLLNLEDEFITIVEEISGQLHVHIELPRKEHVCPVCGAVTDRVHDYRTQVIKDIPMARDTFLHLRKRRYRCDHCGKRFAEENTFVPRYYRVTSRLVTSVIHEFRKVIPVKEIAAKFNISAPTAMRYFAPVSYRCRKLPEVLSIDEFKGNAGGQKYQTILPDPKER